MRYTLPGSLAQAPTRDHVLMSTRYEGVLASIALDSKLNLRFIRTGDASEGARVAVVNVASLFGSGSRHWDIDLNWDPDEIAVEVRARQSRPGF